MTKWFGAIGFAEEVEIRPGVVKNKVMPHNYYGDVIRDTRRYQSSGSLNDNVQINNQFSIVADIYANQNIGNMRWLEFNGTKWKISSVDINYPRLTISIGEVWNEDTD